MIENLVIENYRLFDHIQVDSLARVNLIVGSNNAGKSTLLEAVHLLSSEDMGMGLIFILNERGEVVPNVEDYRYRRVRPANVFQVAQLFHGRAVDFNTVTEIHAPSYARLRISIHEIDSLTNSDEVYQQRLFNDAVLVQEKNVAPFVQSAAFQMSRTGSNLAPQNVRFRMTEEGIHTGRYYSSSDMDKRSRLVTPSYLAYDELALLWDSILLTPREDKVVEALQILEPRVERISFTSNLTSNSGVLIRLKREDRPVPLGSMGDGMRRILAIVASLVSVGNGTLLVDEIDTGLYYDVLQNMWQLVFQTAIKQNAQVFATTHSWDCVKAFQQALANTEHSEIGKLLRLERQHESIKAITYSASELEIAVQQGIEVR